MIYILKQYESGEFSDPLDPMERALLLFRRTDIMCLTNDNLFGRSHVDHKCRCSVDKCRFLSCPFVLSVPTQGITLAVAEIAS